MALARCSSGRGHPSLCWGRVLVEVRLVFRHSVAGPGALKEGQHWHRRSEQCAARRRFRLVAESLWAVGQMLNPFSEAVRRWKIAQEETPPPQIEEEEPIALVAWEIPELGIPRMSAEKSRGSD